MGDEEESRRESGRAGHKTRLIKEENRELREQERAL
jgi:hypothetical protein